MASSKRHSAGCFRIGTQIHSEVREPTPIPRDQLLVRISVKANYMFKSLLPTRILPNERPVVEVGWLLFANQWSMIFDTPRPLFRKDAPPQHAKSASFCPAIIDHESRIFEVTCPYDLQLGCRLDGERFVVWDLSKDMSAVQS